MNVIAWIVLGAVAGYGAGAVSARASELSGFEHAVLGVVGALLGGYLVLALLGASNPLTAGLSLESTLGALVLAAVTVAIVDGIAPARGELAERR